MDVSVLKGLVVFSTIIFLCSLLIIKIINHTINILINFRQSVALSSVYSFIFLRAKAATAFSAS